MIIMFVQSDKYNPNGLLKNAQCEPGFKQLWDNTCSLLQ